MILKDERCNDDFVTFCPYFGYILTRVILATMIRGNTVR